MLIETIEDLIIKIAEIFKSDTYIFSPRDKTVIFSLATQFKKNLALTQKQAELIMRILENSKSRLSSISEAEKLIENPVFKYKFRTVDNSKTIKVVTKDSEDFIAIRFPFNKKLSNTLSNMIGKAGYSKEHKAFLFNFNEHSLVNLLDNADVQDYQFNISQELQDLYYKIKDITDNRENYIPIIDYDNAIVLRNTNKLLDDYFNKHKTENLLSDLFLAKTLGITPSKKIINIINSINLDEKNLNLLLNKHSEKNYKFKFNKPTYPESTIKQFIDQVNQWPIMIILTDDDRVNASLQYWHDALNNIGVKNSKISVLFRSTDNTKFNEYIKNNHLNNIVDDETKVVFIRHKVPKILYKINFKPKMIISSSTFYAHFSAQKLIDTHPCVIYITGSNIA